MGTQTWLSSYDLHLEKNEAEAWDLYIKALKFSNVTLSDTKELIWSQSPHRKYTRKYGYLSQFPALENILENMDIYHNSKPLKTLHGGGKSFGRFTARPKQLTCLMLKKRLPTWDILQRRSSQGPIIYPRYQKDVESIAHFFIHCSFTKLVRTDVKSFFSLSASWDAEDIKLYLQSALHLPANQKGMSLCVCWVYG